MGDRWCRRHSSIGELYRLSPPLMALCFSANGHPSAQVKGGVGVPFDAEILMLQTGDLLPPLVSVKLEPSNAPIPYRLSQRPGAA